MKRILIIVQNLPVPFDARVWQEAKALHAHGYRVCVICPKGKNYPASHEVLEGIDIYRHPLPLEAKGAAGYAMEYGWSLLCEFVLACKIYISHGFDAIHACNPPDTIFLIGGFFKLLFGTRFLFDHHDINPELYEAKFRRQDLFYKLLLLCEQLTFKLADISIATNNSYRDLAITRGKMPPEKLFVVRSGPDLARMKAVAPVPALKYGKPYLVGYLGTMGDQEGIEYLIEAARHIVHEHKRDNIHFTLVGGGTALERLKAIATANRLDSFLNFTGRVSDAHMLEVLSTADICVNPDEVNAMNDKSTMNKIMEYMALGKPIVQFDVTEGRVSAGKASLYARANDTRDFAEKILALLDTPSLRERMGNTGKERIETRLAWHYEIPKLLAAYDALFATPSCYEKMRWYGHRLAAMSPQEMLHRVREKFRRETDRYFPPAPPAVNYGELPAIPHLREQFMAWNITQALESEWEELRTQAQSGKFFLLAQAWPDVTPENQWHLDPITGKSWPKETYCFDIDFRHTAAYGDVKYVWELNRLQYLQPLAALAYKRKDTGLVQFCLQEMENWIDHNPPYRGINWASGIELAMRTVSMLVITTFTGAYATETQRTKIRMTIAAHGAWLERYPSRFSSANNHFAAEGLGLLLIGTLCPTFPSAARWQRQGWKLLCEAAERLILPDGSGAEQAIAYAAFTLEMLLLGLHIAHTASLEIPDSYTERLAAGGEFLRWFTDSGGNTPRIGDNDDARVLGNYTYHEDYVLSVLGCIAAVTARADLTPPGYVLCFRNVLFGFRPSAIASPLGIRHFHDGGYTVWRQQIRNREVLLAMDHGNLGYLSIAAHGHADALSLWLHIDGQPVLVDAGTYLYHSGGNWRKYFRSTQAHNTLCMETTSSSAMAGNFNWSRKATCSLVSYTQDESHHQLVTEHDGYKKSFGIIHRRCVSVTPASGFTVEDTLSAKHLRHVEIGFLIHPSLKVEKDGKYVTIKNGESIILRIAHTSPLASSITQGWYSPRFGEKLATSRIVFSGVLAPQQKALTVFEVMYRHLT